MSVFEDMILKHGGKTKTIVSEMKELYEVVFEKRIVVLYIADLSEA